MLWARERLDGLLRRFGLRGRAVPLEPVSLHAIGVVRNNVREPRPDGWEHVRSDLVFRDDLLTALDGIEAYSHVIVIFSCHRVPEEERTSGRLRPRGDRRLPEQGVLATRSQRRPTAIGVSVVAQLRRRHNILRVQGLDAIDGVRVTGHRTQRMPHHASCIIERVESSSIVEALAMDAGILASSGSACSAKALKHSYVLEAIGIGEGIGSGALVFALGLDTTRAHIDAALAALPDAIAQLRGLSSRA